MYVYVYVKNFLKLYIIHITHTYIYPHVSTRIKSARNAGGVLRARGEIQPAFVSIFLFPPAEVEKSGTKW